MKIRSDLGTQSVPLSKNSWFSLKTHRKSPDFASFPSNVLGIFVFFPSSPALVGGTKSFQLREKTAAIDRSRGVRFRSAQELYLTPSRRKVIEL